VASTRKKSRKPEAPSPVMGSGVVPQKVTPVQDRRGMTDDTSRTSHGSALTMATLESTVQDTVQKAFMACNFGAMIQQAVSQSMNEHMRNLDISSTKPNEAVTQQNNSSSQGKARRSSSHSGSDGGDSSGVAADG
jgi:hypothetical protein